MTLRPASLQGQPLELIGAEPSAGQPLTDDFSIPPARLASVPLTADALRSGVVVVSTLPNIHRQACITQIAKLEEHRFERLPQARVYHVAADPAHYWHEVDDKHPNVRAPGYTLEPVDESTRRAFTDAFGVGVVGNTRIAHGLFLLIDGRFRVVYIPFEQMGIPDIHGFLDAAAAACAGEAVEKHDKRGERDDR